MLKSSRISNQQRGQTIALVAISMISFIVMAALAIDLTSLYSARSEIQRAADAAAPRDDIRAPVLQRVRAPDPDVVGARGQAGELHVEVAAGIGRHRVGRRTGCVFRIGVRAGDDERRAHACRLAHHAGARRAVAPENHGGENHVLQL